MAERRRLLFITLSNIGDLVMTSPVLETLHAHYPQHAIDIVADRRSSDLVRACPYRGRLLHRDKRAGLRGTAALIKALRSTYYDVAVDLRTAFLTCLLRCGQRGAKQRKAVVGAHAVEHHFTALRTIAPRAVIPPTRVWLDDAARREAHSLLGAGGTERRLVVAPGANWPGKIWPLAHYANTIEALADEFDRVIVIGSAADRPLGEALSNSTGLPVTNLAGATDLLTAAACMLGAKVFIGNDSGLGHMAAALEVPTVTVFGPGQPTRYRPWGNRAAVVLAPNENLAALGAEGVVDAVRRHNAAAHPSATQR